LHFQEPVKVVWSYTMLMLYIDHSWLMHKGISELS